MLQIYKKHLVQAVCISIGVIVALLYGDPFTIKSIEKIILDGKRINASYELLDDIKTSSIPE